MPDAEITVGGEPIEGVTPVTVQFASGFQVASTEGSLTLMFQTLHYGHKDGALVAEPEILGGIVLSHVIARDLMNVLGEVIRDAEAQTGAPIPNIGRFKEAN